MSLWFRFGIVFEDSFRLFFFMSWVGGSFYRFFLGFGKGFFGGSIGVFFMVDLGLILWRNRRSWEIGFCF